MSDYRGKRLGNYEVSNLLGRGGFADVYLGEHIHLGTKAAIKVLHTRLAEEDTTNFRNEARTIAQLIHPNIVRVLDFNIEEDTPYLVLDYASNGTLRQRHPKRDMLPLPTIILYVKQVASALQYAHKLKIVHRDVKPENILVGRGNEILLSDFGIAIIAQSSRYAGTLDTAGTISYMAPEQIQGHPQPASDQYALGIITYEWLCGERPFNGTFTEIAAMHSSVQPPPLNGLIQLSPHVEQVVIKALAKEPSQRFINVEEFAMALEEASKKVVSSHSSSPNTRLSTEKALPSTIQPSHIARMQQAPTVLPSNPQQPYQSISSTPYQQVYSPYLVPAPSISPPPPPVEYPLQHRPKPPSYFPLLRNNTRKENIQIIILCNLVLLLFMSPEFYEFAYNHTGKASTFTLLWIFLIQPLCTLLTGVLLGSWRGMLGTYLPIIVFIVLTILIPAGAQPASLSILVFLGIPLAAFATGILSERRHTHSWKIFWIIFPGSFIISFVYWVFLLFGSITTNLTFGVIVALLFYAIFLTVVAALLEMFMRMIAKGVQKRMKRGTP